MPNPPQETATMRAVTFRSYGGPEVLDIENIPIPKVKKNEVLIKVHTAAANPADWRVMRGQPYMVRFAVGIPKPKYPVLGTDVAGTITAIGSKVTDFAIGDEVFGQKLVGGFAEYVSLPTKMIAKKPRVVSFEKAAALPIAGITALQGLRDSGKLQEGQSVLIHGASGGVGTFAVQLAKYYGATVTGVCSTKNVELVKHLGADHVIDYTQEDFSKNGIEYDLILDAAAYRELSDYKRALAPKGIYVLVGGAMGVMFNLMLTSGWRSLTSKKKMKTLMAKTHTIDLEFLAALVETNRIIPVIETRYSLDQVPEAMTHLEKGHTRGKVIIEI